MPQLDLDQVQPGPRKAVQSLTPSFVHWFAIEAAHRRRRAGRGGGGSFPTNGKHHGAVAVEVVVCSPEVGSGGVSAYGFWGSLVLQSACVESPVRVYETSGFARLSCCLAW